MEGAAPCIWDMGATAPAEHSHDGREGAPQ